MYDVYGEDRGVLSMGMYALCSILPFSVLSGVTGVVAVLEKWVRGVAIVV